MFHICRKIKKTTGNIDINVLRNEPARPLFGSSQVVFLSDKDNTKTPSLFSDAGYVEEYGFDAPIFSDGNYLPVEVTVSLSHSIHIMFRFDFEVDGDCDSVQAFWLCDCIIPTNYWEEAINNSLIKGCIENDSSPDQLISFLKYAVISEKA